MASRRGRAAVKPKRRYSTNVRERVLELLGKSALTREQLVAKGRFSPASLNIHLRALRREGRLATRGKHPIVFSLRPVPTEEPEVLNPEPGPATATLAAAAPMRADALDAVDRRLGPKHRFQEKLMTLERLAASLPRPIAQVLEEIRRDYLRHEGLFAAA